MLKILNNNKWLILLCLALSVGGLFVTKEIIRVCADLDKFKVAYSLPKKYQKKEQKKEVSIKLNKDIRVSVDSGDFKLHPEGFEILNFKNLSLQLVDKSKIDKKESSTDTLITEPDTKPLIEKPSKAIGIGIVTNPLYISEFGVIGSIKLMDTVLIQIAIIQKDLFKESKILANILFLL